MSYIGMSGQGHITRAKVNHISSGIHDKRRLLLAIRAAMDKVRFRGKWVRVRYLLHHSPVIDWLVDWLIG